MQLKTASFYLTLILSVGMIIGCRPTDPDRSDIGYVQLTGKTMGTTYTCTYRGELAKTQGQSAVDSLLRLANSTASTYIPDSWISRFNQSDTLCSDIEDPEMIHMREMFQLSKEIHEKSEGYFDPTLMPLVNLYGFGYKSRTTSPPSKRAVDSLLQWVGLDKITVKQEGKAYCMSKDHADQELDLSAVAKGYGVDMIAHFFHKKGCTDYYVNIGGEVVIRGESPKGRPWKLGINYPDTTAALHELYATYTSSGAAMATSGNYRNYYTTKDAKWITHTINPKTGEATPSDLLSTTIIGPNCAQADALATACMAMGFEKSLVMMAGLPDYHGFYIYADSSGEVKHLIDPYLQDKIVMKDQKE